MATNEFEPEPAPTRAQQLASIFGKTRTVVTGSTRTPLRVFVLFMAAVLFVFLSQPSVTWAEAGLLWSILLLAMSWPRQ